MARIDASKVMDNLTDAPAELQLFVRNRLLAGELGHSPRLSWHQALLEAHDEIPDLAAAAAACLDRHPSLKAGSAEPDGTDHRAKISALTWSASRDQVQYSVGSGRLLLFNLAFTMLDVNDALMVTPALAELLNIHLGREIRQCVILHLALGLLLSGQPGDPDAMANLAATLAFQTRFINAAQDLRLALAQVAAAFLAHVGAVQEEASQTEIDCRVFAHDALTQNHDRDVRCIAAFLLTVLAGSVIALIRLDYYQAATLELITGAQTSARSPVVFLLVWRGHMRLMIPHAWGKRGRDARGVTQLRQLIRAFTDASHPPMTLPSKGWEDLLSDINHEEATLPTRAALDCDRCKTNAKEERAANRVGARAPASPRFARVGRRLQSWCVMALLAVQPLPVTPAARRTGLASETAPPTIVWAPFRETIFVRPWPQALARRVDDLDRALAGGLSSVVVIPALSRPSSTSFPFDTTALSWRPLPTYLPLGGTGVAAHPPATQRGPWWIGLTADIYMSVLTALAQSHSIHHAVQVAAVHAPRWRPPPASVGPAPTSPTAYEAPYSVPSAPTLPPSAEVFPVHRSSGWVLVGFCGKKWGLGRPCPLAGKIGVGETARIAAARACLDGAGWRVASGDLWALSPARPDLTSYAHLRAFADLPSGGSDTSRILLPVEVGPPTQFFVWAPPWHWRTRAKLTRATGRSRPGFNRSPLRRRCAGPCTTAQWPCGRRCLVTPMVRP